MADAICRAAMASNSRRFMWHRVRRYIATLFDVQHPPSLNWIITLASSEVPWSSRLHDKNTVARWAAAVSAVPHTEEVCPSVVEALLQIASIDSLRPHIPIDAWAWLKKWTPHLPLSGGRSEGSRNHVIRHVRTLGDIEILKSYFLLVWSDLGSLDESCFAEVQVSIREDFSGVGMWRHRQDLIDRLDQRLEDLEEFSALNDDLRREKEQYLELKDVLLEVDRESTKSLNLTRKLPIRFFPTKTLILVDVYRIPLNLHMCSTSFESVISHFGETILPPRFVRKFIPRRLVSSRFVAAQTVAASSRHSPSKLSRWG